MPRAVTQLSVFVSSPGGLSQDRGAVQSAIEEANRILAPEGAVLQSFFWEKDVVPTKGSKYAQEAINSKILDETDILIVLMHSRVGTATPSAVSGTIEEFEVAHRINESDSRRIEICIYFSVSPISPLSDLDQLRAVQNFRSRVHGLGYLSRDYDSVSDFGVSLISHVVEKARSFITSYSGAERENGSSVSDGIQAVTDCEDEESFGFLDYEDIASKNIGQSGKSLEAIAEASKSLGEITVKYTKKLDNVNALVARGATVDRKALIDEFSDELSAHNAKLEPLVSEMEAAFSTGASASLSMLQEWPLETPEARASVREFADVIGQTLLQMDDAIEPIAKMAVTLESWPGLTKKLKTSRRRAVAIHSRLYSVMRRNQQVLEEARNIALRRLEDGT
jgi:hypothetical protein